jgi:hypothetical protein
MYCITHIFKVSILIYIYIYIYICVCVCVCVRARARLRWLYRSIIFVSQYFLPTFFFSVYLIKWSKI